MFNVSVRPLLSIKSRVLLFFNEFPFLRLWFWRKKSNPTLSYLPPLSLSLTLSLSLSHFLALEKLTYNTDAFIAFLWEYQTFNLKIGSSSFCFQWQLSFLFFLKDVIIGWVDCSNIAPLNRPPVYRSFRYCDRSCSIFEYHFYFHVNVDLLFHPAVAHSSLG